MRRIKILLIDDSATERHLVQVLLRDAPYDLVVAEDGSEGLRALGADKSIDIVLLDYALPGLNGFEVLQRIGRRKPGPRVIMFTSSSSFEFAREAMRNGAVDYISKPVAPAELLAVIARVAKQVPIARLQDDGMVFLSYAREDAEQVVRLAVRLKRKGFTTWLDTENLVPGDPWLESIERAISKATVFVACLSNKSVSKRGIVQAELRSALDARRRLLDSDIYLIPVRLEECEVPETLQSLQWVDYFHKSGPAKLIGALEASYQRRIGAG